MGRGQNTMGNGLNRGLWYAMDRWVKIPWVGGPIYHGWGVQYTMGRGQNTMGNGLNIPLIGGLRYTIGLKDNIQWVGSDMPWLGGLIYHRSGCQYTMGRGDENNMGRGSDIP